MLETPEVFHEESKDLNILNSPIAIPMCSPHLPFVAEAQSVAQLGDYVPALRHEASDSQPYCKAK